MKFKVLTCEALARPVYWAAAHSAHIADVELVARGLHNRPNGLREMLQKQIDAARGYDAVLLAYGLCGQATAGLAATSAQLVIPRAHDCITLFLGSRERYQDQFNNYPGTFWYAQDYIERDDGSGSSLAMGAIGDDDLTAVYQQYVEKYGQDNADYLMVAMGAWQSHYQRAVYIDMGISDGAAVEAKAREQAVRRGWVFERLAGDLVLMRRLLDGDWDRDFLVVPAGAEIIMSYDENVMGCK